MPPVFFLLYLVKRERRNVNWGNIFTKEKKADPDVFEILGLSRQQRMLKFRNFLQKHVIERSWGFNFTTFCYNLRNIKKEYSISRRALKNINNVPGRSSQSVRKIENIVLQPSEQEVERNCLKKKKKCVSVTFIYGLNPNEIHRTSKRFLRKLFIRDFASTYGLKETEKVPKKTSEPPKFY